MSSSRWSIEPAAPHGDVLGGGGGNAAPRTTGLGFGGLGLPQGTGAAGAGAGSAAPPLAIGAPGSTYHWSSPMAAMAPTQPQALTGSRFANEYGSSAAASAYPLPDTKTAAGSGNSSSSTGGGDPFAATEAYLRRAASGAVPSSSSSSAAAAAALGADAQAPIRTSYYFGGADEDRYGYDGGYGGAAYGDYGGGGGGGGDGDDSHGASGTGIGSSSSGSGMSAQDEEDTAHFAKRLDHAETLFVRGQHQSALDSAHALLRDLLTLGPRPVDGTLQPDPRAALVARAV